MADSDRFESVRSLLEDSNSWRAGVAALADFDLVSLHVSPGEPTVSLTFELLRGENSVSFTVVFHGVGDLAITRWGALSSYAVRPREQDGWQADLRGPESGVAFTFASIGVDGVRHFRAGAR